MLWMLQMSEAPKTKGATTKEQSHQGSGGYQVCSSYSHSKMIIMILMIIIII